MRKQIYKNNLRLSYTVEGKGDCIILIHGFLEDSDIWTEFSLNLSKDFTVIAIDLPGHGKSELHDSPYTMCKYAEAVLQIMNEEKIEKAFVTGHSMGGYAALAFAENYPERLTGLSLFHSSPFADNEQKKDARNNLIKDIRYGKKTAICDMHMKNVFAEDNIQKFEKEIITAAEKAKMMNDESIISSVISMRDRKDRSEVLKKCKVPFLYILGMKDNFIPKNIIEYIDMPEKSEILILEQSGHMGMYEERVKALEGIKKFYHTMITK